MKSLAYNDQIGLSESPKSGKMKKSFPTFLESCDFQNLDKRKRYFSESVYDHTPNDIQSAIRYALQTVADWLMLIWNTVLIFVILLMMGALQFFLSISDDSFLLKSRWLRIRRGKELLYRITPTRLISRLWGIIHSWRIPLLARPFIYHFYSLIYGVKINEAADTDLSHYPNLGAFFRRPINPNCRPLARTNLVSPCDGKVLTMGQVDDGCIEQIKGQSFTVAQFLGADIDQNENVFSYRGDDRDNRVRYCQSLLRNPSSNDLFYCVIYLAPGDYHRFHAPCNFRVKQRRHFPGALYSVNPSISCWLDNLFCVNERVTLIGEWMHGFFSYTAVGATMVGSIKLGWDNELRTNRWHKRNQTKNIEYDFKKGQEIGEFNLGSTIVLIYEAPRHYNFTVKENEHLKLGDALTVKMKKRHSMPNLLQVPGNATLKQSETFDSKLRLRKKHSNIE